MNRFRTLWTLPLFLFALGCGKSGANLAEQLKSADSAQRLHAVLTLQQKANDPKTAVPLLTQALGDDDVFVRRDAVWGLGHFGSAAQAALPTLRTLCHDAEPSVRKAARLALGKIDPHAAEAATVAVR